MMTTPDSEIRIIEPEEAAAILAPKIEELRAEGWKVVTQTDFMVRMTRDKQNLDLRVDLLGKLETEEKPLTILQESGSMIAIVFLLVFFLIALTLLTELGIV